MNMIAVNFNGPVHFHKRAVGIEMRIFMLLLVPQCFNRV